MLAYVRYVRRPGPLPLPAGLRVARSRALAKPMLVTLPFVLLLMDYWPLRRAPAGRRQGQPAGSPSARAGPGVDKLPLLALAAASCVVTGSGPERRWTGHDRGAVSARRADRQRPGLVRRVPPEDDLARRPRLPLPASGRLAAALEDRRGRCSAGVRSPRSRSFPGSARPWLSVGWLWYLGTLVPVIGLVQVASQAMADRYTYVPSIGLFIARLGRRGGNAGPAARTPGPGCRRRSVRRRARSRLRDRRARAARPLARLGDALRTRTRERPGTPAASQQPRQRTGGPRPARGGGRPLPARDRDQARLRRGVLQPGQRAALARPLGGGGGSVQQARASALRLRGDTDAARMHYERAVELTPRSALAHQNLGDVLWMLGRREDAIARYRTAFELNTESPLARQRLEGALATPPPDAAP